MKIMKKVVLTGVITAITLLAFTATTKAATVKVTGEVVNVRKSASTSSEVVAMLSEGIECEYLGEEGDWYEVKYKSYTGYVTKQYAKLLGNNTTTENTNIETPKTTTAPENNDAEQINQTTNNNTETQTLETKTVQYQKLTRDASVKILPLIQSRSIGTLKKDVEVILIAKTGSWAYIQSDEFNGWVRTDILTDGKTVSTDDNSKTNAQEKTAYINESYVNIRTGAGTNYSIVKVLTLNSQVTITGEEGDWYQVKSGSDTGYVSKQFVSDTKTATNRSLEVSRTEMTQNNQQEQSNTNANNETTAEVKEVTETNTTKTQESTISTKEETSETKTEITKTTENTSKAEATKANTKAEETTKSETSKTEENIVKGETTTLAKTETTTTTSTKGEEIVTYAKKFLGARYVYGGDGSNGTFDCSGFTMYVYNHFGISLPHGATSQSRVSSGTKITSQSNLKAGDIVFLSDYETGVGIGHCGIYIGDGNFIHASTTSYQVIISSLNTTYAGRFVSGMRFF